MWLQLATIGVERRAWLVVSEVHYIHSSLVPPVEHKHYQDMPHLVAGTQIVQLTCGGQNASHGHQKVTSNIKCSKFFELEIRKWKTEAIWPIKSWQKKGD